MRDFLRLPEDFRRAAYLQAEQARGLAAASVEKDLWVCLLLRELFALPDIGGKLTFKGGTSLSKAWGIIERFSEDIDIVVDKDVLGVGPDDSPAAARSNSQRERRIKRLDALAARWISGCLLPALISKMEGLGCRIGMSPDDPECIHVEYPSVFAAGGERYVSPVVKVELGARPENCPHVERSLSAYVLADNPQLGARAGFGVRVIAASRTFWEKVCLLHEERLCPEGKPRRPRLARHFYDLWCLDRKGVADQALADPGLFRRVVDDRRASYNVSWVRYERMTAAALRILPAEGAYPAWRADYAKMRAEMFFGESPDFDQLMEQIRRLEMRVRGGEG